MQSTIFGRSPACFDPPAAAAAAAVRRSFWPQLKYNVSLSSPHNCTVLSILLRLCDRVRHVCAETSTTTELIARDDGEVGIEVFQILIPGPPRFQVKISPLRCHPVDL